MRQILLRTGNGVYVLMTAVFTVQESDTKYVLGGKYIYLTDFLVGSPKPGFKRADDGLQSHHRDMTLAKSLGIGTSTQVLNFSKHMIHVQELTLLHQI